MLNKLILGLKVKDLWALTELFAVNQDKLCFRKASTWKTFPEVFNWPFALTEGHQKNQRDEWNNLFLNLGFFSPLISLKDFMKQGDIMDKI